MAVLVSDDVLIPIGFEQLTPTASTALAGATKVHNGRTLTANRALVTCTTQDVRWRDDGYDHDTATYTGTVPTASVGVQLKADNDMFYNGDLLAIRFIEETSGAILNVAYYYAK